MSVTYTTHRFTLRDPAKAWEIVEGSVDLFIVDVDGEEPRSSLVYIGTLEAGAVLLGVGGNAAADGLLTTLLAQPAQETVLQPLVLEGAGPLVSAAQIELWIATMSRFCVPGLAPATSRQITPGVSLTTDSGLDAVATALVGTNQVAWVTSSGRAVRLFGREFAAEPTGPVPVGRNAWVLAEAGETLTAVSTEAWLDEARRQGSCVKDLGVLHRALLLERAEQRDVAAAQESARFGEKLQRDGTIFLGALKVLASPLEEAPVAVASGHALASTVIEACRAVAAKLGIEIVAPKYKVPNEPGSETLKRIASASKVRYRQVLLRDLWWKSDQGEFIGFTATGDSAVAFLSVGSNRYEVFDPATGTREPVTDEVAARYSSYAYVLYRRLPDGSVSAMDVLRFGLKNKRKDLTTILVVSALAGLFSLTIPISTGVLFDQIIPEGQRRELIQLSIILFSASASIFLMDLCQNFITLRIEGKMESEMQAAVWDRLLSLPADFFRRYSSGDLASRSLAIDEIRKTLTGTVVTAFLSGVLAIVNFGLLFLYSIKLALMATGLALFASVVSYLTTRASVKIQRTVMTMQGKIEGRVTELLQGVSKFHVSGTEPRAFARWASDFAWQQKATMASARIALSMQVFNTIFPAISAILIYISAAALVKSDPAFSTGDFLAFNAAFGQFLVAALGFSAAILSVVAIVPAYERAKPILDEEPETQAEGGEDLLLQGEIEMSHVSFRYQKDGPLILHDVSFTIRTGQYVAIVGESGSGKSTIMRLLLGFEKPEAGTIFYDGRDLNDLDVRAMRKQLGVVLQAGKLVTGDIHTNIVGGTMLTLDDSWEAARMVGLDEDIREMPMGMYTVVNESGSGLSGGQRQRILIARSIVRRPHILFFDEATSALDNRTQATVSKSLETMQATRIVIAHRLSTIQNADLIIVLRSGVVEEAGTYDELVAKGGYFSELAKRQTV